VTILQINCQEELQVENGYIPTHQQVNNLFLRTDPTDIIHFVNEDLLPARQHLRQKELDRMLLYFLEIKTEQLLIMVLVHL
jgi:hypothetical protein